MVPNGFNCSNFNCIMKLSAGFKRYIINETNGNNIYFNVINPKKRKANYIIRYYYTDEKNSYMYYLNKMDKEYINTNNEKITLSLTFDPIEIICDNKTVDINYTIYFYISGLLYKKLLGSEELINTTAILYENNALYENKTIHTYNLKKPEKFKLIFNNIPRKENYIYDLQIQANIFIESNLFIEGFLIFTKEIDLTDITIKEEISILWYIIGPILGFVFLLLFSFLVIKFIRLKKANADLQEEIKSMAYSNDVYKDVIKKDKDSQADKDYDSTFL